MGNVHCCHGNTAPAPDIDSAHRGSVSPESLMTCTGDASTQQVCLIILKKKNVFIIE